MAVGFGCTTQTADQIIENWFKKPTQGLTRGTSVKESVLRERHEWKTKYMHRAIKGEMECSLDELLTPDKRRPRIYAPKSAETSLGNRAINLGAEYGNWDMLLCVDKSRAYSDHYDFTINVKHGRTYRFEPSSIEYATKTQHGEEAYRKWKSMVVADLKTLGFLIQQLRKHISRPHVSITCSEKSARLCTRLGIPVRQGVAFLLPIKYN